MYDLITIGPAGIDTLVALHDANVHCTLNTKACELCFRYAEKIIADDLQTRTAHNGMNNAVGSARLGLKTALYTVIGDDPNGRRILEAIKKAKVDSRYVQIKKGLKSNASVVIDFKGERTILVYHEKYIFKLPLLAPSKWFYLTSFGENFAPLYRAVVKQVKSQSGVRLAFNPGSYQLRAGTAKIKSVLNITDTIFVNREEARILTDIKQEKNEKQLLKSLHKLGPKIVVLTDGPKGSYASDGQDMYFQKIYPAKVVERTGGGDSYASAFIASLNYGHNVPEAMRWGSINSAHVIQAVGGQVGLLSATQIRRIIRAHPKFKAKKI